MFRIAALVAMLALAVSCIVFGQGGGASCYEGCSDTHEAESWDAGKEYNCKVFQNGKSCLRDDYDLVATPVPNAYDCQVKVPTDKCNVYYCDCEEYCLNGGPGLERQMTPPKSGGQINYRGCSGPYEIDEHECLFTSI